MSVDLIHPNLPVPAQSSQKNNHALFYEYYLSQHQNRINRILHIIGTTVGITGSLLSLQKKSPLLFAKSIISGYALAWAGHFLFEKNQPATLHAPIKSLLADIHFYRDVLLGKQKL